MRDKRPDTEDPHFQRVPNDEEEEHGIDILRALVTVAVCTSPFVVVFSAVALWPYGAPGLFGTPVPAATGSVGEVPIAASVMSVPAGTGSGTTVATLPLDPVASLHSAQERVAALESEVAATLRGSLAEARTERDALRVQLKQTVGGTRREATARAGADANEAALTRANSENVWVAFTQAADVEVCDQWTQRGRAKCRAALDGWLGGGERHDRFTRCVAEDKSVPTLWRADDHVALPPTAEAIDLGSRAHDDWYVLFCDPTLPEVQLAEAPDPPRVFVPGRP
jgi:hypothetical protein